MSIENNLKRIADALEAIAVNTVPVETTGIQVKPAAAPEPIVSTPAAIPQTASEVIAAPAPAPAPETHVTEALRSDEEMNGELVKEFQRLGGREAIDAEMAKLNVAGVSGLTAEVQTELLTAIREIPTP